MVKAALTTIFLKDEKYCGWKIIFLSLGCKGKSVFCCRCAVSAKGDRNKAFQPKHLYNYWLLLSQTFCVTSQRSTKHSAQGSVGLLHNNSSPITGMSLAGGRNFLCSGRTQPAWFPKSTSSQPETLRYKLHNSLWDLSEESLPF